LNYKTVTRAAGIKYLVIDFSPSNYIFSGIGETFSNLKQLSIHHQLIESVERSDFDDLTQLETLLLSGNQIESLPEDVFWDLPNLKLLSFSRNKIKKLPENIFKNLKKLKEIYLYNNKIDHLPKNLFVNNLEIEVIWAHNNPLKTIDVDFTKLTNLSSLDLKNANCIDFKAENGAQFQKTLRLINQNCRKTTKK
jgi:Leucine-rich repeat (LRR) protein